MADEFDIERIEADYRAGQFSLREIGRLNGVSEGLVRKLAKKHGWQRDLTQKVRDAVRSKTVRSAVRAANPERVLSDEEIVEEAGHRGAEALGRQGRVAGHGVAGAELMAAQATAALAEMMSAEAPKTDREKIQLLARAERAGKLLALSMDVLAKASTVERLALGIEDKRGLPGEDGGSTVNVYQIPSNGRD